MGHLGAGSHGRFSAQFKRGGGWPDLSGTNESPEPTTGSGGVVWGGGGRGRSAHRGCPGCRCSKAENASLLRCLGWSPLREFEGGRQEQNERGSTSEGAKMVPGFAETRFRMSDAVLRRTVDAAS